MNLPWQSNAIADSSTAFQENLLAVELNGAHVSDGVVVLRRSDGILLVPQDVATNWRLRVPNPKTAIYDTQPFLELNLPGKLDAKIDDSRQVLTLQVDPSLLAETVLEAQQMLQPKAERSGIAGFLNYDFNVEHTSTSDFQAGALELGISTPYGLGTTAAIARRLSTRESSEFQFTRLYTTWLNDNPAEMTTFLLGDNITRPWQRGFGVRFAGIQYTRDFGTQPRFIRFPLQTVLGDVPTSSLLDVYVNNNQVDQRQVPAGPFTIKDLPVVSGAGEIRVVSTDLLGRRQEIVQPFYLARTMLKEGLTDFSYEAGFLRRNYGTESYTYGAPFGSATYRQGITSWFTGEANAQVVRDRVALASAGSFLVGTFGVVDLALGGSMGRDGPGGLAGIGFSRQGHRLSFGGSAVVASQNYSQLGIEQGAFPTKQITDAFIGWNIGWGAALSIRYATAAFQDRPHVDIYALNYIQNLWGSTTLTISAIHTKSTFDNTQVAAIFTLPLGEQTYSTLNFRGGKAQGQREQGEFVGQVGRNLGWGPGWGYRMDVSSNDIERGQLNLQTDFGLFSAEAVRFQGDWAERAFGSGGIGVVGGKPFASRRIQDSYALIKVGEFEGVRVYADNQLIGKTNESGYLLLPRLRAYDVNIIRVEAEDLPMDAQIDRLEQPISPYFRSGMVIDFPVRRSLGALLKIVLDDGSPMPAGAETKLEGAAQATPVALEGEVYLTGLADRNRLTVTWEGQSCAFDVIYPKTDDPLPHLGTFVCTGVRR
ncbi:MAG: fimbria/pilus outer membrane usher protein [Methylotetracoccus sp.]